MITTLIILQLLVNGVLGFLLIKTKKEKIIKEIKEGGFILKNPVKAPDFDKVDPEYQMIKDVIESIKLEKWAVSNFRISFNTTYEIELINGSGNLKVKCRLDTSKSRGPEVGSFRIYKMVNKDHHSHVVSYDNTVSSHDKKLDFLILNLMWDYVLDHHQKTYDKDIEYHLKCKLEIEKELTALKRDRTLMGLLEN